MENRKLLKAGNADGPGPLRIVFYAPAGEYGGAHSLLHLLNNAGRRFIPTVVCPPGTELWERLEAMRISRHAFSFNCYRLTRRPDWHVRMVVKLAKIIRKSAADLVVANHTGNFSLIALSSMFTGRPLIRIVRRSFARNDTTRLGWAEEALIQRSSGVVFISEFIRDQFRARLRSPLRPRSTVIYNPQPVVAPRPDEPLPRDELGVPPGRQVVGMFGNIYGDKGHDVLVAAAPAIIASHPDVHFLIVGDFSDRAYKQRLLGLIHECGVAARVTFAGYRRDVLELMSNCVAVVMPSRCEALGRVLLESWSVRRPVVGSNVGGIREIIEKSGGGLLFPSESHSELAQAVNRLLSDKALREALAARGCAWVRENCDPDSYAQRFYEFAIPVVDGSCRCRGAATAAA